ncbi:class I SAM-dependent methyltransferase [Chlorobaculum sp. MV4-Y]|uniref:class I SAM-dependent methyltransferase n=1 Tax=Chlorobaculum sp. MV4-Y TaxID=2976335 RepID=UPI0021AFE941|nr:class I SAM-dependent methyltransferase [Chlorobaculum sp. MV4-Y]UWX58500.1 class I SAM-dependent methyltransferase [Chlorobaculum sp. MV4-Y]
MSDHQSHSREENAREWFEEWFDHPLYLKVYHHRDAEEAERCVRTILDLTGIDPAEQPPHSILDIACGAGRHALSFARTGLRVTANDLSPYLLGQAREQATTEGIEMEFSRQDMRTIRFERQFDLIAQLFSSFGYFETDQEDRDVIANISSLLSPGGWYVLDLINPAQLKSQFTPRTERNSASLSIIEERTLSERHVTKRITLHEANGREHSFTESVRIYSPAEAIALLESGGFAVERMVGDYEGSTFDEATSPRMMLLARLSLSRS